MNVHRTPAHRARRASRVFPAGLVPTVTALAAASATSTAPASAQDVAGLVGVESSELAPVVERYSADRVALGRRWTVSYSPERTRRFNGFFSGWQQEIEALDFDALSLEGRVDYVLLLNELRYQLDLLTREARLAAEMDGFISFTSLVVELEERRRRREPVESESAAARLAELPAEIEAVRGEVEARLEGGGDVSRIVALRAVTALAERTRLLEDWYEHYAGYDPVFTWWNEDPYARAKAALDGYATFLRESVIGYREGEDEPIVGDPIGAEGLAADLRREMIPYSPAELIAIAEREYAWCEERMIEASRELGYGDDWRAALEYVKTLHRDPGDQPQMIRELADEALAFVTERDLVTVPPLADEVWRIEMMSPERQKVSPFFLGGEVIQVSFPTDGMEHEYKLMSMRGNNEHFSRATVHHELIPGHHLQGFMTSRFNSHRRAFSTPFWGEGWALYWEMLLWDLGFPSTPEDRIGMLFWRMHRTARIIFSLSFHLERMTPQEAIDFLVERVGHERANAEAEVRRSFNGSYSPLYQVAYMIGGLQFRALHEQLVQSGEMTNRAFHDAILRGGRMPVEMVRARLLGEAPARDFESAWRFQADPMRRTTSEEASAPEPASKRPTSRETAH